MKVKKNDPKTISIKIWAITKNCYSNRSLLDQICIATYSHVQALKIPRQVLEGLIIGFRNQSCYIIRVWRVAYSRQEIIQNISFEVSPSIACVQLKDSIEVWDYLLNLIYSRDVAFTIYWKQDPAIFIRNDLQIGNWHIELSISTPV